MLQPLAVGLLGLSPADLADMEHHEVAEALYARITYDQVLQRGAWERARILAYYTVAPHMRKGANKSPRDFMPLPWDKEKTTGKGIKWTQAELDWIKVQQERYGK